ncbi:MAG: discoidin domain-containing protein [Bacteroidales bacterium]|nr:discoidin domain-containing protein [Bacteroidales bacterium]
MKKIFLLLFAGTIFLAETSAQCFPDRHNSTWFDGWISCDEAESPNPERGMSHWIMYDFVYQYQLGQVHLWNSNDPKNLDRGVKQMIVDYSTDGENWTELGTYNMEMASGKTTYQGFDGPDFEGTEARYLLLTAKSNWGGDCVGFSEIRIQVEGVNDIDENELTETLRVTVFPNPFKTAFKAEVKTQKRENIAYRLIDIYGRQLRSGTVEQQGSTTYITVQVADLQPGVYFLIVQQGESLSRHAVVKAE